MTQTTTRRRPDLTAMRLSYACPEGADPATHQAHAIAHMLVVASRTAPDPAYRQWCLRRAGLWRLVAIRSHRRASARFPMTWAGAVTISKILDRGDTRR